MIIIKNIFKLKFSIPLEHVSDLEKLLKSIPLDCGYVVNSDDYAYTEIPKKYIGEGYKCNCMKCVFDKSNLCQFLSCEKYKKCKELKVEH